MNKPSPLAVQAAPALSGSAVPSAPPRAPVPPVPSTESVPSAGSVESVAPVKPPAPEDELDNEALARHRASRRSPRRSECKSDAEHKRKWNEWWERMGREARESSIRRGTYNPGIAPPPEYGPDREKKRAEWEAFLEEFRAAHPGPHPDSTPYFRRGRDLNLGHGCTEEELKEWEDLL